ncbi:multidrug ABC transporter permease [Longispora fulva]|uniref:ATP-binding cassette subfamily B protein n=1 Tax=Longispora fulva TaxID=619741 RepID=A0A8J7GNT4_9ACTN|nr:ABC transporter ATP-binding protein [Longispora fulva]MBG6136079.1 ATP-binding cassette subfamily B protein [Longispora fulva]GIG55678.1 multidrug ABC transporter permease [Longispora fulva]
MTPARHGLVATTAMIVRSAPLPVAALTLCTVLAGFLPVSIAWSLKVVLDSVTGTARSGHTAALAAIGLAGGGIAMVVTREFAGYLSNTIRRRVRLDANAALYRHLATIGGIGLFEDPGFQNSLRMAGDAADTAPSRFLSSAVSLVQGALQITGWLVALLAVWPPIVPILVVALVPAILAQRSLARHQAGFAAQQAPRTRRQVGYRMLMADPAVAKEIRLFGVGRFLRDRMLGEIRAANTQETALDRRMMRVRVVLGTLDAVATVIAIGIATRLALTGAVSVGGVSLFLGAVAGLQGAAIAVIDSAGSGYAASLLLRSLHDVLARPSDVPDGTRSTPRLARSVELRDVWFRYRDDLPWVLRGVSLTVPAGATVGLVGVNGAGKSTLVKLLCRLHDPQHGQILWDGVDVRDLELSGLRDRISAVFQDFVRYDLTATENIAVGDIAALDDPARIRRAAELADAHTDLAALPAGYRTLLSRIFAAEDGSGTATLSGGQWQRVALARAFLRGSADLLILDEPTAGLDAEAEHDLHVRLRELRAGRTSLLISHRMSSQREADVILVLENGTVAEQGRHAELVASGGAYARLFDLQSRGYRDAGADRVSAAGATGVSGAGGGEGHVNSAT